MAKINDEPEEIETLQDLFQHLSKRLDRIEQNSLLQAKNILTSDDVCALGGFSRSHLEKLTCYRQIPFFKDKTRGRQNYFDRKEFEEWQKGIRYPTQDEYNEEAAAYCLSHPTPTNTRR